MKESISQWGKEVGVRKETIGLAALQLLILIGSREAENKGTQPYRKFPLSEHNIYGKLHSTTAKNTLFSSSYGIFTMTDHILHHKTQFNEFKRTEIIQSIFSELDLN